MENKKYIIANWKMNPASIKEGFGLLSGLSKGIKKNNAELVICPPGVFLNTLKNKFKKFNFGAQNIFWEDKGAYTGENSALMIKNLGVEYTIIGHSERREHFGESDEAVNLKIISCLKNKVRPILCVGEKEKNRETEIKEQLDKALRDVKKTQLKNILIAYEPVWAISGNSNGVSATVEDAFRGLLLIRKTLTRKFNRRTANSVSILYGGSVNSGNVSGFINEAEFGGVLVGGRSLDVKEFIKLVGNINK